MSDRDRHMGPVLAPEAGRSKVSQIWSFQAALGNLDLGDVFGRSSARPNLPEPAPSRSSPPQSEPTAGACDTSPPKPGPPTPPSAAPCAANIPRRRHPRAAPNRARRPPLATLRLTGRSMVDQRPDGQPKAAALLSQLRGHAPHTEFAHHAATVREPGVPATRRWAATDGRRRLTPACGAGAGPFHVRTACLLTLPPPTYRLCRWASVTGTRIHIDYSGRCDDRDNWRSERSIGCGQSGKER